MFTFTLIVLWVFKSQCTIPVQQLLRNDISFSLKDWTSPILLRSFCDSVPAEFLLLLLEVLFRVSLFRAALFLLSKRGRPSALRKAIFKFFARRPIDIFAKCLSSSLIWKDHLSFLRFECFAIVTWSSFSREAWRAELQIWTSLSRYSWRGVTSLTTILMSGWYRLILRTMSIRLSATVLPSYHWPQYV